MARLQHPETKFVSMHPAAATVNAVMFLLVFSFAAVISAHAQTFRVIHSFSGPDGQSPGGRLVMDSAGNLYGATGKDGPNDGYGTVFELSPSGSEWNLATLHVFDCSPDGGAVCDGLGPNSGVIFGPDGRLYGTTCCGGGGLEYQGITFRLTPASDGWDETVLSRFGYGPGGESPNGSLAFDAQGNVYGSAPVNQGYGVVYRLSPSHGQWQKTMVWTFGILPHDGVGPEGIIRDNAGNLYGATGGGGEYNHGTVFELTPTASGWTEKILYSFQGESDGSGPVGVIFDQSGNLFGATISGGTNGGGTVFELARSGDNWRYHLIYALSGKQDQGGPVTVPSFDSYGNLYGTTWQDGAYGLGNVFKLEPSDTGWQYTDLHDFQGGTDGALPVSTPIVDANGNIYGTASRGGGVNLACSFLDTGCGVVFQITP